VLTLIETHPGYLLKKDDFVAIEASWDAKNKSMQRILELTRIHHESVVFIDDNPVELLQMKSVFPGLNMISANEGPEVSVQTLQFVPGYRRAKTDVLADVRKSDLISNGARRSLINNGLKSYFSVASPIIKVLVSNEDCLDRLVDLGKRSNQFNLLFRRMEKSSYQEDNAVFVGLGLIDRFSDSGVIGGMVVSKAPQETLCVVEEMFLSCRVLGRGLETALLCQGMLAAIDCLGASDIQVSWVIAQRNKPALDWLASCILSEVPTKNGTVPISRETISFLSIPPEGVICEISR
jgi:FkbH-like protein